jgi:hypothetical protein
MDIDSKDFSLQSRSLRRTVEFRRATAKYILIAFAIALGLHIVGLTALLTSKLFQEKLTELTLLPYEGLQPPVSQQPLVLQDVPTLLDIPERARTKKPPDDSNPDVSDKNSIARNRIQAPDLPEDLPFSEGDFENRNMTEDEEAAQHDPMGGARPLSPRAGGLEDFRDVKDIPMWSSELILRPEFRGEGGKNGEGEGDKFSEGLADVSRHLTGPEEPVFIPRDDLNALAQQESNDRGYKRHSRFGLGLGNNAPRLPRFKNNRSVSKDYGDFSLSTYAWDYAPYMFMLRERVRRRWFAPEAFNLGLVSGRVIVTFKIMPNGNLRDLEVMSYRDNDVPYQSLVNASVNAIESSNPFPPLPADFLDPYLEITGTFYYQILGFE